MDSPKLVGRGGLVRRTRRGRRWLWALIVIGVLCTCFGVVCNPVGGIRMSLIERRLAQALKKLPKGSNQETVRRFASGQGLKPYDLTGDFGSYPPQPLGAVYEMKADDPYVGQFFGMTGGVRIDFWFDKNKRYLTATLDTYGAAL